MDSLKSHCKGHGYREGWNFGMFLQWLSTSVLTTRKLQEGLNIISGTTPVIVMFFLSCPYWSLPVWVPTALIIGTTYNTLKCLSRGLPYNKHSINGNYHHYSSFTHCTHLKMFSSYFYAVVLSVSLTRL